MNSWVTKTGQKIIQVLSGRSNAFLVCNGDAYLLVDCGTEKYWPILRKNLEAIGVAKGNLAALMLTHAHFDHVENARRILDEYGAQLLIHKNEATYLEQGINSSIKGTLPPTKLLTALFGKHAEQNKRYAPVQPGILVDGLYDLGQLGFGASVLHTPGHTAGSACVIVDNEIALVGDAMFGIFKNSVFPPYAESPKVLVASWGKLLDTGCTVFLPGHGTQNSRDLLSSEYLKYKKKLHV